ncbi:MAG: hypothetical protein HOK75_05835 [Phycisphaerae bacterium]|nr:hypothetical protein [Phycisphaerae bacterium]MBT5409766.1 hypothetical protein [Phycisphaerae bacterium]MBT6165173.1 hypothetical protein [Phycisphaerae bacterium]MBT7657487.1 hypothetical protein [Phycisphaerae bacterium]
MIRILLLTCIAIACAGCSNDPTMGYSSSSLYATQFKSVSIPIFGNESMEREIEFMLTDAVIKEVEARTPYQISSDQYADTTLTGTIQSVTLKTISQSQTTRLDNEMLIIVVMDFEWTDLTSGRRIVGRKNFTASALFIPSAPSSEPIEMGKFAVVQLLASDIVDQMQASW